jgi:uncharacterized protein (TIGR02996 family)
MSSEPARPELLALLADCKEHPDQEGLRLILADWLEEHGTSLDQARAELIRAQIEHERLQPDDPARKVQFSRARQLQQRHGRAWLGPLAEWVPEEWVCDRGLLAVAVTVPALRSRALGELASSEAWAWVELVCIKGARDVDIARLAASPLLAGPTSVAFLHPSDLGPAGAQALAQAAWMDRIVGLDLGRQELTPRGLQVLFASPHLGRLRQLDYPVAHLTPECLEVVAASAVARRLERLGLWGNDMGDDGVAALLDPATFSRLQVLDLHANLIGDAGASTLAGCPALAALRRLDLRDNRIGSAGAAALASSPHLSSLKALLLWGNPVGADGARALNERFGPRVHVSPVGS